MIVASATSTSRRRGRPRRAALRLASARWPGPSRSSRPAPTRHLAGELVREAAAARAVPVLGITGTGGSGKSSLTDELVRRLPSRPAGQAAHRRPRRRPDPPPRRRRAARRPDPDEQPRPATRLLPLARHPRADARCPTGARRRHRGAARPPGFDLVIVETPGIGQGDAAIVPLVDVSLYVMTPEFGAASQLEKIDMLDFADVVAINKFERRGAEDARRDVRASSSATVRRSARPGRTCRSSAPAPRAFDDDGVTALYQHLRDLLAEHGLPESDGVLPAVDRQASTRLTSVLPPGRVRYLAEIAETVRGYHADTERQVGAGRGAASSSRTRARCSSTRASRRGRDSRRAGRRPTQALDRRRARAARRLAAAVRAAYSGDELVYVVRGTELHTPLTRTTLSGTRVPRVALPPRRRRRELLRFLRAENLPGYVPVHRRACSRSSARARTRPACSPARATPAAPTAASTCCPRASRPPGCRRRSTR